jgi:hypothetical protein
MKKTQHSNPDIKLIISTNVDKELYLGSRFSNERIVFVLSKTQLNQSEACLQALISSLIKSYSDEEQVKETVKNYIGKIIDTNCLACSWSLGFLGAESFLILNQFIYGEKIIPQSLVNKITELIIS